MTAELITLFPPNKGLRREHAIIVFEASTRIYTPSAILDNWAFLWFD